MEEPGSPGSMVLLPELLLPHPIPLVDIHFLLSHNAIAAWLPQEAGTSGTVNCVVSAWNAATGVAGKPEAVTLADGVSALSESFYQSAQQSEAQPPPEGESTSESTDVRRDNAVKYVGAWGVVAAVEKLRKAREAKVVATRLLGARQVGGRILGHQTFMTLKETDDEKKIDKQWDILKSKIMQPNLALIFSQGTHFALVFALREQKKSDGATIRSLLTANKGEQHPSLWIDWDEVRQMMLRDLDSKVMTVEIEPEKPKDEEEEA